MALRWMAIAPCLLLAAAPAAAMPIQDAVRVGLAIQPQVRAAELDAKAAANDITIARSGYYPSLSASASPVNSDVPGVTYDVTLSQVLYDWGHVASQVAGAKAMSRQLSQDLKLKRDTQAFEIVNAYLDVLEAQKKQLIDRGHIERLEQILKMTEERGARGFSDSSEAARTNLNLASAQEQLANDEGDQRQAENQFRLLVGLPATDMQEPVPQSLEAYVTGNGLESLVERSPSYMKSVEDMRYAEAQLDEARSAILPQINVEASTGRDDLGGVPVQQSYVGVRLKMNSLQGLSSFQKVDSASTRAHAARLKRDAAERDLARQVQGLIDKAAQNERREGPLRDQVKTSTELASTYQEQFHAGRRDVIELLNVQLDRFQAERALIDARMQKLHAQYQAAAQLGLIGPLLEGGL